MVFLSKVKRIGGSTYVLVPPDVARELTLVDGQEVEARIERRVPTLNEVVDEAWGLDPDAKYFDRRRAWPERKIRGGE